MTYGDYLSLDVVLHAQHPLTQAHDELREAVGANRESLVASAEDGVEQARRTYREALQALVDAHAELAAALALRAWVHGFPDRPYNPAGQAGTLPSLLGRNDEPTPAAAALAALGELAEEPKPAQPAGVVPRTETEAA